MTQYANETVRVVNVKPVNHLRYLVLTLVTGGLWGVVWAYRVLERNMTR